VFCITRSQQAAIVLAVAAGGLFTGCGGDDDPDAAGSGPGTTTHPTETSTEHGDAAGGESSPVPDDARHVPVTARSFAFDPDEISVEPGEAIAIVLTSEDELHDFVIDEVDAHVSAAAGQTAVGGFQAAEPGRYAFYCSVAGHRDSGMEGTLVVEAEAEAAR